MAGPRFVHLTDDDRIFTFSINIDHIVLVRDSEDPESAWVWLHGESEALKVHGSRNDVLLKIASVGL